MKISKNETLSTTTGSIFNIAPEVIKGEYSEKCDLWSIGVITFTLITGRFPFDDIETKIKE